MTATKELIAELETILDDAASDLKKVSTKKMFGCHALFADGKVFALVWKHGQIGIKLTNETDYENERRYAMEGRSYADVTLGFGSKKS